jgi:hypothetical protein
MKIPLAVTIACTAFTSCEVERKVEVKFQPPKVLKKGCEVKQVGAQPEVIDLPDADLDKRTVDSMEIEIGGGLSEDVKDEMKKELLRAWDKRVKVQEAQGED